MTATESSVSVLIPCRNAERYLPETLASVDAQTLRPREVIVVDDASTDRSREIAERWPGVTSIESKGRGASAARNRASEVATGSFFQYLDADDRLEPHALASRVEALERTGGDVAISDWQRMNEVDGVWRMSTVESGRLPDTNDAADLAVFRGFWAPPAAILYRRTLCERIGGWRHSLPVIQDARYLFDAARIGRPFVYVPGVGARYRDHRHGSLSKEDAGRFWRDVLVNAQEIERLWKDEHRLDAVHQSALATTYGLCARMGFVHDETVFDAGRQELRRFEHASSRFLRAAVMLTRLVGYRNAKAVLGAVSSMVRPSARWTRNSSARHPQSSVE